MTFWLRIGFSFASWLRASCFSPAGIPDWIPSGDLEVFPISALEFRNGASTDVAVVATGLLTKERANVRRNGSVG